MRRIVENLDVEHRRQPAQPLRADAEPVDLVVKLDAQLFDLVLRPARLQLLHVDGVHQRLLGQQHRLLRRAANADAEHPRRTPARAHRRHRLQHPVHNRVRRIQHHELRLRLRASALGRDGHIHLAALAPARPRRRRRIVLRVLARKRRVGEDAAAQLVVRVEIGLAHARVAHLLQRQRCRPAVRPLTRRPPCPP